MRVGIIILLLCMMIGITNSGYCQNSLEDTLAELKVKTIHANVTSVDSVASTLVVDSNSDEMLFFVPNEAKIFRGQDSIDLDDLNISDPVIIKYYDSDSEPYKVISIIDNNLGEE